MQLAVILSILVALGSVSFALQNSIPVTVTFLVWRFDSTLAMVLLIALALGAIIVALVSTPATLKARWSAARLRKQVAQLEAGRSEQDKRTAELEGHLTALRPADSAPEEAKPIMPTFPMTDSRY